MDTAPGGDQNSNGEFTKHRGTGRRWLPVAALAGLAAVAAGGGGAVAATLVKHSDSAPSAAGGPSIYIPYAGSQGSGATGGGGASGAASLAQPVAPQFGRADAVNSFAASSTLYPYPYPGFCSGNAPAQVSGQVITATGMERIDVGAINAAYVLNASVNNHGTGDLTKEVADTQARINAVADALVKAGVPRSSIHTSNISVWVSGGKVGVPVPLNGPGVANAPNQFNVSAGLVADLGSISNVESAVSAASGAGADNVSVYTQGPAIDSPSADKVAAAIGLAASQARSLADAEAKAANVTLGAVHSMSAQQPTLCGYGPDGPQLVVAVTIAYDFK